MKTASIIGSMIVTLALIFYTIAFAKERKAELVLPNILLLYTTAVLLDITATVFMIIGSSKGLVTIHGLIGYSSLTCMLIDTILLWRFNLKFGSSKKVSKSLHLYSLIAYCWWIAAYITGGLLVAISKIHT